MRIDFPELEQINAKARRERAEAVYRLIIAPIQRFFTRRPAGSPQREIRYIGGRVA
jgi:hypothetical protein